MTKTKVLLVDDEPALLKLMSMYLDRMGFDTATCPDSESAWAELAKGNGVYKLLIVDLSLSGVAGDVLGLRAAERDPKLAVLICSGYPYDVDALPEPMRHRFSSLLKPFLPNMLAKTAEELLARQTS